MHFLSKLPTSSLDHLQTIFIGKNFNTIVLRWACWWVRFYTVTPHEKTFLVNTDNHDCVSLCIFVKNKKGYWRYLLYKTAKALVHFLHFTWRMKRLRFQMVHVTYCLIFFQDSTWQTRQQNLKMPSEKADTANITPRLRLSPAAANLSSSVDSPTAWAAAPSN